MFALFKRTWFQKFLREADQFQPLVKYNYIYTQDQKRAEFQKVITTFSDSTILSEAKSYLSQVEAVEKRETILYLLFCIAKNTQDTSVRQYLVDEYYNPQNASLIGQFFDYYLADYYFNTCGADISLLPKAGFNKRTEKLYIDLVRKAYSGKALETSPCNTSLHSFCGQMQLWLQHQQDIHYAYDLARLAAFTGHESAKQFLFNWFNTEQDKKTKATLAINIARHFQLPEKHPITHLLLAIAQSNSTDASQAVAAMKHAPKKEVQPFLLSLIRNEGSVSLSNVVQAIGVSACLNAEDNFADIAALLTHRKRDVRWAAVQALSGQASYLQELLNVIERDPDQHIKGLALAGVYGDYSDKTRNTILAYAQKITKKGIQHPYLALAIQYLKSFPSDEKIQQFLESLPPELHVIKLSPESQLLGF